ncbi:MAG TPA: hypothetical protein VFN39_09970 [Gemmatimonadaceae bacterium]|nr:hypothetical protein [Gemmatimonadaceae bacterium]
MRTPITARHLVLAFATACATREKPAPSTADTTRPSAGNTLTVAHPGTVIAPQQAVRKLVVNPPPPIMPADTVVRADSSGGPRMPVVLPHWCEGEDCEETFRAIACREVQLRVAPSDSSAVVAELLRGDTVEITRRDLHVLRAGRIIVRRLITIDSYTVDGPHGDEQRPRDDTVHFAPGDTVYLLAYTGMGSWYWWHAGKAEGTELSFAVADDGWLGITRKIDADSRAIGLSKPQTADWWLVRPRVGGTGWWRNDGSWSLHPDTPSIDAPDCPRPDSAARR